MGPAIKWDLDALNEEAEEEYKSQFHPLKLWAGKVGLEYAGSGGEKDHPR